MRIAHAYFLVGLLVVTACLICYLPAGCAILIGGDIIHIDAKRFISEYTNAYDTTIGLFRPNQNFVYAPYYYFINFLLETGLFGSCQIKVSYIVFCLGAYLTAFYSFNSVSPCKINNALLAVFYATSPLVIHNITHIFAGTPFYIAYVGWPLILCGIYCLMDGKCSYAKPLVLVTIGTGIASISFGNLAFFFSIAIISNILVLIYCISASVLPVNRIVVFNLAYFFASFWAVFPETLINLTYIQVNLSSASNWIAASGIKLPYVLSMLPYYESYRHSYLLVFLCSVPFAMLIINVYDSCRKKIVPPPFLLSLYYSMVVVIFIMNKGAGWLPSFISQEIFTLSSVLTTQRSFQKVYVLLPAMVCLALLLNRTSLKKCILVSSSSVLAFLLVSFNSDYNENKTDRLLQKEFPYYKNVSFDSGNQIKYFSPLKNGDCAFIGPRSNSVVEYFTSRSIYKALSVEYLSESSRLKLVSLNDPWVLNVQSSIGYDFIDNKLSIFKTFGCRYYIHDKLLDDISSDRFINSHKTDLVELYSDERFSYYRNNEAQYQNRIIDFHDGYIFKSSAKNQPTMVNAVLTNGLYAVPYDGKCNAFLSGLLCDIFNVYDYYLGNKFTVKPVESDGLYPSPFYFEHKEQKIYSMKYIGESVRYLSIIVSAIYAFLIILYGIVKKYE